MTIVPNWRDAWKWLSIQLAVVGGAMQTAVLTFPDLKNWLGDTVTHLAGLLMLCGIVAARLVNQPSPPCPPRDVN